MITKHFFTAFALAFVAACAVPHPPPHGPVASPAPQVFAPKAVIDAVRADYPQAKLEGAESSEKVVLTFGPGAPVKDIDSFVEAFVTRHSAALAAGPTGESFVPEGKLATERILFGHPLRDTGCGRVRLAFVLGKAGPETLQRTCERLKNVPPRYAGRPLPSTATGDVDILVRVGVIGGIGGPIFSGYVIDRFGDVYSAADPSGWRDTEPSAYLRDYVKTLPPAEVEQFAFDVSLVAAEKEEPEPPPAAADMGGRIVQGYLVNSGRTVNLSSIAASAARRATRWAIESVPSR